MPNELNNKQCDALQRETKMYVGCYGTGGMWEACDIMNVNKSVNEQHSRQAAITAYWQKYHKEWTPPVIHDEKWALMYVEERHLVLGYEGRFWDVHRWGETPSEVSDTSPVEALEAWKAKHAPDKPTREETATTNLLRKIVDVGSGLSYYHSTNGIDYAHVPVELIALAKKLINKETDHVD